MSSPPTDSSKVKRVLGGLWIFFCLYLALVVGVYGWAFGRQARVPPGAARMTSQGLMPTGLSAEQAVRRALEAAGCGRASWTPKALQDASAPLDSVSPTVELGCVEPTDARLDCELMAKVFLGTARPRGSFLTRVQRAAGPSCLELYTAEGMRRPVPRP